MTKFVLGLCWMAVLAMAVSAQPPFCSDDEHCPQGRYCEANECHECLRCEELRRQPPLRPTACIKSLIECGACIKDFVEDVGEVCVRADSLGGGGRGLVPPVWAWVLVALAVLAFVVVVIVYVLKHKDTLKIQGASAACSITRGSVESGGVGSGGGALASAPELPPPYNATYAPDTHAYVSADEESSWPFIKPSPSPSPHAPRQAAGSQEACVFNNPAYVRGPHLPSSVSSVSSPVTEQPEETRGFTVIDEDTVESVWTPHAGNDDEQHGAAGDVTAPEPPATPLPAMPLVAAAAASRRPDSSAELPPPPKILCVRQDPNNNRSRESGEGAAPAPPLPPAPPSSTPSFIINVVQNISTVKQRNDVTL